MMNIVGLPSPWHHGLHTFRFPFVLAVLAINAGAMHAEIISSDRRITWAAGVPGGIPYFPTGIRAKDAPYNAVGNGIADDTNAIQKAINACPVGHAVFLPAGNYRITTTLVIRNSIVLRGAGIGQTTITHATGAGFTMIYMNNGGQSGTATSVTAGATKGSTKITVSNGSLFSVGNYVYLRQLNPSYVSITGDNGTPTWVSGDDDTKAMSQLNRIVAKNGNNLTLERPYYLDMPDSPEIGIVDLMEGGGIEDLSMQRTDGASSDDGWNINICTVAHGWIKNVSSLNTARTHFRLTICFQCEIRECIANSLNNAFEHDGDHAYGYFQFDWNSDNLIEDNIAVGCRHSLTYEGGGSGSVVAYNFTANTYEDDVPPQWLGGDSDTHAPHPFMNLFEGNYTTKLAHDDTFGSASHNTSFRCYFLNDSAALTEPHMARWAVDIQNHSWYNNVIGCVIGQPGDTGVQYADQDTDNFTLASYRLGFWGPSTYAPFDPNVKATTFIHGTYDFIGNMVTWDPSNLDHRLPNSLYLSSKPSWWGNLRWPAFGPDLTPMIGMIPAQVRYMGATQPPSPTNLHVVTPQ
jgi:hypothetical protein